VLSMACVSGEDVNHIFRRTHLNLMYSTIISSCVGILVYPRSKLRHCLIHHDSAFPSAFWRFSYCQYHITCEVSHFSYSIGDWFVVDCVLPISPIQLRES